MITLVSGVVLTPVWWLISPDHLLRTALTVTLGHLISGLVFSCDLDVYSTEYQRWGPLRIIWWPYQHMIFHRSVLSHGLVIGPLLRLAYFGVVVYALAWLILGPLGHGDLVVRFRTDFEALMRDNSGQSWAFLWGFITGGAAHTIPDWLQTSAKRARREWKRL
ncbi:MAG: metal-binding protein [Herpetosiphonaceae bacterium]|nr:metal-binding protein [Herpetosiphonaceae bacterium]